MANTLDETLIGFFDDAAVFPPRLSPLNRAVQEHLRNRTRPLGTAVGPLILPLKDIPQAGQLAIAVAGRADDAVDLASNPLRLGVVVPVGELAAAIETATRLPPEVVVDALELKTSPGKSILAIEIEQARKAADSFRVFVELTLDQISDGALGAIEGTPVMLKYRTGGLEAGLFPSSRELATVIKAAVGHDVSFKLTAGLHEAVRFTNSRTGLTHHGFLNIAIATASARGGADVDALTAILEERDGTVLADKYREYPNDWRHSFLSFGTCSVSEPAESLVELGLLSESSLKAVT